MNNLNIEFCGVKSPNPFWLASAPPTNSGKQIQRAFEAGWGGAVWKTLANPVVNVSSRLAAVTSSSQQMIGLNNIELITDRPLALNLKEMLETKKMYPEHTIIASLMAGPKEEWQELTKKTQDVGADLIELNFGCPHGMCERGMGSAIGQEPEVIKTITSWVKEVARIPVIVKLTPNVGDIIVPAKAAQLGGADALSLINTIKSLIGVNLESMTPYPEVAGVSTNGGYCGPAVKPIALHMLAQLARSPDINIPISGIGGISNWSDSAEFLALGATSVQVCTAVMRYGYRIVEEMKEGLSEFLIEKNYKKVADLSSKAVSQYKNWNELDLNHHIVAQIDPETCIGCNQCFVSCMDGAHQCIHIPGKTVEESLKLGHEHVPEVIPMKFVNNDPLKGLIPFVDESECVGCNLCTMVCPVNNCITMVEKRHAPEKETWNDRIMKGTDYVEGGLECTENKRKNGRNSSCMIS